MPKEFIHPKIPKFEKICEKVGFRFARHFGGPPRRGRLLLSFLSGQKDLKGQERQEGQEGQESLMVQKSLMFL
jgi:hypothetical protein